MNKANEMILACTPTENRHRHRHLRYIITAVHHRAVLDKFYNDNNITSSINLLVHRFLRSRSCLILISGRCTGVRSRWCSHAIHGLLLWLGLWLRLCSLRSRLGRGVLSNRGLCLRSWLRTRHCLVRLSRSQSLVIKLYSRAQVPLIEHIRLMLMTQWTLAQSCVVASQTLFALPSVV